MKEVFQVLAEEHDRGDFPRTMVSWFCEHFGIERCSLMLLDRAKETLEIAAQRGISPLVASKVRVRIGQGIAGWVAHNRKPLFVRVRDDAGQLKTAGGDAYNSDSFISVPLVHNDRLVGVLNLSNSATRQPFDELDSRSRGAGGRTARDGACRTRSARGAPPPGADRGQPDAARFRASSRSAWRCDANAMRAGSRRSGKKRASIASSPGLRRPPVRSAV